MRLEPYNYSFIFNILDTQKLNKILHLGAVFLVGGTVNGSGNVFARNPTTGIYGPVCDDLWDFNAVRNC